MSSKKMGFYAVLAIVFGSQIGSGIFMLPSTLAPYGMFGIYGWFFAGIGAILLATVFSGLCSKFPNTGGPHSYVKETFGNIPAFFVGWAYWLISWVSSAVVVISSVAYLLPFFGEISQLAELVLEIALLLVIMFLNCRSVELSGNVELILTIMKFIPFIIVPAVIIWHFDASNIEISPEFENMSCLKLSSIVAVLCFWGFIGVECATTPAEAVETPSKTIPKAIVLGTCAVAVIYLINSVAVMGVIPSEKLAASNAPFVDAIKSVAGTNVSLVLSLIASVVCVGTLNAWVLTSAQISLGLAQDGFFPKFFAKKNSTGAPYISVIICCVGMIPILVLTKDENLSKQISYIINFSVLSFVMVYAVCCLAYLKISFKEKNIIRTIIGSAALYFCIFLLLDASLKELLIASLFFVSGLFVLPSIKNFGFSSKNLFGLIF